MLFNNKQIAEIASKYNLDLKFTKKYYELIQWRINNTNHWPNTQSKNNEEKKLGLWCTSKRIDYKNQKLSSEKIKVLNEINFSWDPNEEQFQSMLNKLIAWRKTNPNRWPHSKANDCEEKRLGVWCSARRQNYKNDRLSLERIKTLEAIGFSWDPLEEQFQLMFNKLLEWKKDNPDRWPSKTSENKDEKELSEWCTSRRQDYKNNRLSPEKIKALEAIGFFWDHLEEQFQVMLTKLIAWRKTNPNRWPRIKSNNKEEKRLGEWCGAQRQVYKNKRLSLERIEALEVIGFSWDPLEEQFQLMFNKLLEWKKDNPDRWPSKTSENKTEKEFGEWCTSRRQDYKNNRLSPERIMALEAIGFPWKFRKSNNPPDNHLRSVKFNGEAAEVRNGAGRRKGVLTDFEKGLVLIKNLADQNQVIVPFFEEDLKDASNLSKPVQGKKLAQKIQDNLAQIETITPTAEMGYRMALTFSTSFGQTMTSTANHKKSNRKRTTEYVPKNETISKEKAQKAFAKQMKYFAEPLKSKLIKAYENFNNDPANINTWLELFMLYAPAKKEYLKRKYMAEKQVLKQGIIIKYFNNPKVDRSDVTKRKLYKKARSIYDRIDGNLYYLGNDSEETKMLKLGRALRKFFVTLGSLDLTLLQEIIKRSEMLYQPVAELGENN